MNPSLHSMCGEGCFRLRIEPYDRDAVVRYAHAWAYGRNPLFYDYEKLGGDCTNFASQCVYAGSKIMNYTPTYGWYYLDANNKSPSWTGVPYFYNFMTRSDESAGPIAIETTIDQIQPGDVVQLSFTGEDWNHTPVIVQVSDPYPHGILVAAHSYDADNRPLSSYQYKNIRYLHFIGVRK